MPFLTLLSQEMLAIPRLTQHASPIMTLTQEELSDSMVVAPNYPVADIWRVTKEDITFSRIFMPIEPLLAEWNKLLMKSNKT